MPDSKSVAKTSEPTEEIYYEYRNRTSGEKVYFTDEQVNTLRNLRMFGHYDKLSSEPQKVTIEASQQVVSGGPVAQ